ncbi:FAD-dependent oxidoreductase [Nocardia sp. NPDC005998]|uniref:FAD-dependent oxidoreductase n=1 Tax=Nocardia sp. NPDC005998 TaxID=3156894 RepID=UPI0033BDCEA6
MPTAFPTSKIAPTALVIGAGVNGLTTALCLRHSGFKVTILTRHRAPDTVSMVAGALWEWPPAVCGAHTDTVSLARAKGWSYVSYREFERLSTDPHSGVFLRPAVCYLRKPLLDDPAQRHKATEMRNYIKEFRHDAALIDEHGVNPEAGAVDAYSYLAPMVDTEVYLPWLLDWALAEGVDVRIRGVDGDLRERSATLRAEYRADIIINCAGLGAAELAGDDTIYPLRGALVHVLNDGIEMPRITAAHFMAHDASLGRQNMVSIVPRGNDTLVLGGLVEPGEWSLDLDGEYPPIRDMVERCRRFLPALRTATADHSIRVGLHPARKQDVRLDFETETHLVHNYGHGGSGVTLSWGCAREVARMATHLV